LVRQILLHIPIVRSALGCAFCLLLLAACKEDPTNWPEYNGGPDRNHYSALSQIKKENIAKLTKVWEYHSGGADTVNNRTQIQCNPIIIDGVLYGVSAGSQAFALDAATGAEIWKTSFNDQSHAMTSRGVTYYENGENSRIFFGYGQWLYSLDAATGKPIPTFGKDGRINLIEGLWRPGADDYVSYNTPGIIFKNLLITGQRVSEGATALLGDIRAYDANTGQLAWTFHTIPEKGEPGSETWPENARRNNGGANSWMGMALDTENEIVYAPTGSAAFDFYGGDRVGSNLYANSLIALDANTGKHKWHYQIVHHDIWDRDIPAPPNLFMFKAGNQQIPAVAQVTKQGHVFVFNRLTGEPLFPIEERKVEGSDIPGEQPHPTQPIPLKPKPFTRQSFTLDDLYEDVADRDQVEKLLRESRTGSAYIPITRQRTIIFPGTDGGAQWGGAAVDIDGVMYVPAKEIPVFTSLADAPRAELITSGKKLYDLHCAPCHGTDLSGDHSGSYPSLVDLSKRTTRPEVVQLLQRGRGMMPPFTHLTEPEKTAIVSFIMEKKDSAVELTTTNQNNYSPYVHTGYNRWYDSNGLPVSKPPWGTLTAIDLKTGEHRWQIPLGEFPELSQKGLAPTGTDNYGGPLVIKSGLVFIAATPDKKFRAFDNATGTLLWEGLLPAAGYASPSTYAVNGRQYIVIACGGGKLRSTSGDSYVAFALD
jgi:quinoprotein glucose dehydrogenase